MDRQKEDSYQIVNYYKRNRTIDMLLMEEFAFSLLFNNIAPDKLQVALDSVGLNRIPSLFLLIQVDDHLNESKRLNTENEFVLKVRIADIIRTCFERNGLEPVVANLTGTDKLVAFLVMDESVERDMMGISEAKREKAEKFTIKQMEKTKKGLQAKIDKLNDQSRKDDVVTFEELGVDRIFIDESHYFKNRAKRCA